jgi:U4/U6.U5 tri-snRNP-associated protein 2
MASRKRKSTEDPEEDLSAEIPAEEEEEEEQQQQDPSTCPYLDTINRSLLDFDFEKVCSVTLQNLNVYACLVCGKYYQGRGRSSPAHFHSLQANHHVFINLHSFKVYCLPDNYEVNDSSLEDVKYVLNPTYTLEQAKNLDSNLELSRALDGTEYLPGVVGLNNIKLNDSINAILQSLVRIPPLRDYFIMEENYLKSAKSPLVHRFGELIRKVWNPRNFKGHVSPHELLQAISISSNKRFRIGYQSDPVEFLSWFLNTLHTDLGGTKKKSTIITKCFQGKVKVITKKGKTDKEGEEGEGEEGKREKKKAKMEVENSSSEPSITEEELPFMFLALDVPPPPLFKDEQERNIIPQVPMYVLLDKYNGVKEQVLAVKNEIKKYIIKKLPPYLILHIKRFTKNQWFTEKNPTIVNFPIRQLELKDYLEPSSSSSSSSSSPSYQYDLLANLKHDGLPGAGKGVYRVDLLHKASDKWFEVQDLIVKETMPQLIALSEAYIQFYQQKR